MGIQRFLVTGLFLTAAVWAGAAAAETIRIADIDAFSGAFANVGESFLAHLRMSVDGVNARGSAESGDAREGMKYAGPTGEVWTRAEDHQLIHPLYLAAFSRAGQSGVKYDAQNTGYGWRTEARIEAKDTILPTT